MEIMEMAAQLGQLIKGSQIYADFAAADTAFEEDPALQDLIRKYNTYRAALDQEENKPQPDPDFISTIEESIDDLYQKIVANDSYLRYSDAKNALDKLMNDVNGEITFQITGKRPCSHDCASCGGCGG